MRPVLLFVFLCISQAATAQVVFDDGDFFDSDWSINVLTLNHPGGFTTHEATGGNPDDHRAITTLSCISIPCRVLIIEMKPDATYDPSLQGAIESLSYEEDQMCASADGCVGGGQGWYPALLQDGKFFIRLGPNTGVLNSWTNVAVSGLVAADFGEVMLDISSIVLPGSNPDFGAGGPEIQFGYARANSINSQRTGRIDNWKFSVFPVVLPVDIDIKPGKCPNNVGLKLWEKPRIKDFVVALLGAPMFDVNDIDVSTIALFGLSPTLVSVEDVTSPGSCKKNRDGIPDLMLTFEIDFASAIPAVPSPGDVIPLTLTGRLFSSNGPPFSGTDDIVIEEKKNMGPP